MKRYIFFLFLVLIYFLFFLSCKTDNLNYKNYLTISYNNVEQKNPIEDLIFYTQQENMKKFGNTISVNPFLYDNSIAMTKMYYNLFEIVLNDKENDKSILEILNILAISKDNNAIGVYIEKEKLIDYWKSNPNIGKEAIKLERKIKSIYLEKNYELKKQNQKSYFFVFQSLEPFENYDSFIIIIKFRYNGNVKSLTFEFRKNP